MFNKSMSVLTELHQAALPVSGKGTAEAHVEIFQVFESDGGFDIDEKNPQGDRGETHTSLWGHATTHKAISQTHSPEQQWKDFHFSISGSALKLATTSNTQTQHIYLNTPRPPISSYYRIRRRILVILLMWG